MLYSQRRMNISPIRRIISGVILYGGWYISYKFSLISDFMTLSLASHGARHGVTLCRWTILKTLLSESPLQIYK